MERPVYLIGYMGAGKTTVGRLLAEELGWRFVDLDDAFLQIHGLTPAAYIRTYGLETFRRMEKDVVERLAELPYEKVIYATGGGYPCWEDNMECLHELGTSIYIRWTPEQLVKRLLLTDLSERPVLQGRTEKELLDFILPQLNARTEFYEQADYIFDAPAELHESNDQQIAQQICQLIRARMR